MRTIEVGVAPWSKRRPVPHSGLNKQAESAEQLEGWRQQGIDSRPVGRSKAEGQTLLGAALENAVLRGELSTTRAIADLRIRVERLEKERGQLPQ